MLSFPVVELGIVPCFGDNSFPTNLCLSVEPEGIVFDTRSVCLNYTTINIKVYKPVIGVGISFGSLYIGM